MRLILGLWLVTSCAGAEVSLTILHSFTSDDTNGVFPKARLVIATNGNLYGTTSGVRMNGSDRRVRPTIFKMTPDGMLTTLAWFDGTNVDRTKLGPWHSDETLTSALLQATDGNFYGVAEMGGMNGYGRVFKMTPAGAVTTLLSFKGYYDTNGWGPKAGLVQGNDGWFYGTADTGGNKERSDNSGMGTVYKVNAEGKLVTLFKFAGTNGEFPAGELLLGKDGNLYGTTRYGGPAYAKGAPEHGFGTIFKITPSGALTTLFSFSGTNGAQPLTGLALGNDGNLYGTTQFGGAGLGTVFRISPSGLFTSLLSFNGTNGARPCGVLVQGKDGSFYGTTELGGETYRGSSAGIEHLLQTSGTIFRINTNGILTSLVSFSRTNGANPSAGLVQDRNGCFYGTTAYGGEHGAGTIFRLSVLASR